MRIVPVACLKDNYAYLVICEDSGHAAVVDPSEDKPVLEAVKRENVELQAIWNTHHHWDHTGGNKALLDACPHLEVVAHSSDKGRIPGQTTFIEEGDTTSVGSVTARILFNPGHTSGAISYFIESVPAVFTGDTLFAAGCGRLFEGSPEQMHESLSKLAALPPNTQVYCGHEYTAANLRFAAAVEPANQDIATRTGEVDVLRKSGRPSVPSTIDWELRTNPFLRSDKPEVAAGVAKSEPPTGDEPPQIFAALRRWKDRF